MNWGWNKIADILQMTYERHFLVRKYFNLYSNFIEICYWASIGQVSIYIEWNEIIPYWPCDLIIWKLSDTRVKTLHFNIQPSRAGSGTYGHWTWLLLNNFSMIKLYHSKLSTRHITEYHNTGNPNQLWATFAGLFLHTGPTVSTPTIIHYIFA